MKTPLAYIADYGCQTNSYIAAIQHLLQQSVDKVEYEKRVMDVIGLPDPPYYESLYFARTMFMYVVQETIRAYNLGVIPLMEDVHELALERTNAYLNDQPWHQTRFNIDNGLSSIDDIEEGNVVTSKKGAKKDITEQIFLQIKKEGGSRNDIIDTFVNKVGMSRAGATTYFHTLKKEFGFSEITNPNKEVVKTQSKQEIAECLYQANPNMQKVEMIALFAEKLDTSKLGAQTYFYSCKKRFNATPNQST
jgi:hypothetical protein